MFFTQKTRNYDFYSQEESFIKQWMEGKEPAMIESLIAAEKLDELSSQVPNEIIPYRLALLYYKLGDHYLNQANSNQKALENLKKAETQLEIFNQNFFKLEKPQSLIDSIYKLKADIYWQLSYAYLIENKFEEAEQHRLPAKAIYQNHNDLLGLGRIIYVQACITGRKGNLKEAMELAWQSWSYKIKHFGPEAKNIDMIKALKLIADLELYLGNYPQAERLYDQIIEESSAQSSPEYQNELTFAFFAKGWMHFLREDLPAAQSFMEKGLLIQEKIMPNGDLIYFLTLVHLAEIHLASRDFEKAKALQDKAENLKPIPENQRLMLELSSVKYHFYTRAPDYKEKLKALEEKLRSPPESHFFDTLCYIHQSLGDIYLGKNMPRDSDFFSPERSKDLSKETALSLEHYQKAHEKYLKTLGETHHRTQMLAANIKRLRPREEQEIEENSHKAEFNHGAKF